jgi:signal transduction histidine kinase
VIELDGTIVAVNVAAARLLGVAGVPGRKVWDVMPALSEQWDGMVGRAREQGSATRSLVVAGRAVDFTATLRDVGRIVVFGIAIDVTQHKRAGDTAQLRVDIDSKQRLESLGLVAGGIAHDFNNQLVSVLAEASSAREDASLSEGTRDALKRIEASAKRMAQLTRQLLAYAGRGRFVAELTDPDELLVAAREQLQRIARDAAIEVVTGAGSIVIETDRGLLRQVIANLVSNATDALSGGRGNIQVTTRLVSRDGEGWWQLEVSDDGIGMDAGTIAKIFDPFFTTKPGRHGLGLSAVHGIIKRLGGEIEVESQLGKGARFRLRLPVIVGVEPKRRRTTSKQTPIAAVYGMRVLIADDEPSVRATVRRLLERRGATVVSASDGIEAEARMRDASFGLMLFDVTMPGKTGYDLLAIARSLHPTTPVMLMSGYTEHRRTGPNDEPDLFLEKPFTTKRLDAAIADLLRERAGG